MSNISEIRSHIQSVNQTSKIAGAQKMIAGAHIGKARRMLENAQPYHNRIRSTIAAILSDGEIESRYKDTGKESVKRGLLVITADKGLAGGYNQNVMNLIYEKLSSDSVKAVFAVGHVGFNKLEHSSGILDKNFFYTVENPALCTARQIAQRVIRLFDTGEIDALDLIYTQYNSAIHMVPTSLRLLPLSSDALGEAKKHFYEFSPTPVCVLETLIPAYIEGYIFGSLVNAWMSELNSRVTAMDSAIRNGNEMLDGLALEYNRARQDSITQEITEIVASAASMKK